MAAAAARQFANPRKSSLMHPPLPFHPNPQGFADRCRVAAARLREAHKIVFSDDFSRLVDDVANDSPETLARLLPTARLPFENCWIEWIEPHWDDSELKRWGALFSPTNNGEFDVILMAASNDLTSLCVAPMGLSINFIGDAAGQFVDETDRTPDALEGQARKILGPEYSDRWKSQLQTMRQIAAHAAFSGLMPSPSEDPRGLYIGMTGENFRKIVSALALLSSHIGGAPLIELHQAKTGSQYYGGKFHPPIEYKVVQLVRPMSAPSVIRRAFPKTAPQPARWHQVIGAWHHRRAPNSVCGVHPRACQRAHWRPVLDGEGKPVGADLQACAFCERHRWFIRDHARGDLNLGMLDKGYEVVASTQKPSGVINNG